MKKLEELDINNTDIDEGLEYLPSDNLEEFYCVSKREGARVKEIIDILEISEEQAGSRSKEDNHKKVVMIVAYQIYVEKYSNETTIIQN